MIPLAIGCTVFGFVTGSLAFGQTFSRPIMRWIGLACLFLGTTTFCAMSAVSLFMGDLVVVDKPFVVAVACSLLFGIGHTILAFAFKGDEHGWRENSADKEGREEQRGLA